MQRGAGCHEKGQVVHVGMLLVLAAETVARTLSAVPAVIVSPSFDSTRILARDLPVHGRGLIVAAVNGVWRVLLVFYALCQCDPSFARGRICTRTRSYEGAPARGEGRRRKAKHVLVRELACVRTPLYEDVLLVQARPRIWMSLYEDASV